MVLYTVVTDERYRVIVITPETQVARDYPITAAALNCKVYAFREVLRATSGDTPAFDPRPLAQELYQILVGPVARDLEGANAQTLMWVLDGVCATSVAAGQMMASAISSSAIGRWS